MVEDGVDWLSYSVLFYFVLFLFCISGDGRVFMHGGTFMHVL